MSDPYTPDAKRAAIANWRGPATAERAFIVLLPILHQLVLEITEEQAISPETAASIMAFLDASVAEGIAASEFMEWAVANAPFPLVSNMARVGLLV